MADYTLHASQSRGQANHGWLKSWHTFSFADYYEPDRIHFGSLRVLNDDIIAGGRGFGMHPHENMEIITIPLEGDLEHKDSMGNTSVIRSGDIQVMSAGTGIMHSEYNKNTDREVKLLQIWVFPNKKNITPRYDQITLEPSASNNKLQQILSPFPEDEGVWIYQQAWFHLGKLHKGFQTGYALREKENGLYIFIISGDVTADDQKLGPRDGLGIKDAEKISLKADTDAEVLLMEIPLF
jgi:redox-sensitive bicupin YhaK (pirin superfamily)